jgi:hypothetical protein
LVEHFDSARLAHIDGDEFFEAGQAFYWSPGHAPAALEDSEYVELSPTAGLNVLVEHVQSQMG